MKTWLAPTKFKIVTSLLPVFPGATPVVSWSSMSSLARRVPAKGLLVDVRLQLPQGVANATTLTRKETGLVWHSMVRVSRDRMKWRELVGGLLYGPD